METTKLLVVVDHSLASMRAVTYVGKILGGRRGFRVCLAHTLPSPPARMMEFGGAEDPQKEVWLEARLHASRSLWVSAREEKGLRVSGTRLRRIAQGRIYTGRNRS